MSAREFRSTAFLYDYIHLGDVLEHVPNPSELLACLVSRLKAGGCILASGPLENNPSFTHLIINSVGYLKFILGQSSQKGLPTHLYRTSAFSQRLLFRRSSDLLNEIIFIVYETGWPYSKGGLLKKLLANTAKYCALIIPSCFEVGNRFFAVYRRS